MKEGGRWSLRKDHLPPQGRGFTPPSGEGWISLEKTIKLPSLFY
jgi:hypothetical protein